MKNVVVVAIIVALSVFVISQPQNEPVPDAQVSEDAALVPGTPGNPGEEGEESRFFFGSHNLHIGNSNGGSGGYPNQGGYPAPGGYPNQGGYPAPGGYPVPGGGYPNQGGYPAPGGYPVPGGFPNGGYPSGGYPGGNQFQFPVMPWGK